VRIAHVIRRYRPPLGGVERVAICAGRVCGDDPRAEQQALIASVLCAAVLLATRAIGPEPFQAVRARPHAA